MNTWFSSDLHFGHANILKYGRSAFFDDLDHMREMIILNWNNLVQPEDTVYVLGDVVMGVRSDNIPAVERLNGRKLLIPGNHDNCHPVYSHKNNFERSVELYGSYFDEILEPQVELEIAGHNVLLCHFPADGDHTEEIRYEEWRPVYDGWIIHGHLHVEEINVAPNHIHIGIDSDWTVFDIPRYSPVPITAIETILERV